MSIDRQLLAEAAQRVLADDPSAPVRVRLLRDVLGRGPDDPELIDARRELAQSRWVGVLESEQRADGGWGPFHSRSVKLKQRTISTEFGVERALALGLTGADPLLARARENIAGLLGDPSAFPDLPEKNDRWPTGLPMILAGTLALIEPRHPAIAPVRELWIELAKRIFKGGGYSEQAEIAAHAELTGATVRGSYLHIANRYAVSILSSAPQLLPTSLEQAYVGWLYRKPEGLDYLEEQLSAMPPPSQRPGRFDRWLTSLELISRLPGWREHAATALDWLWAQRDSNGMWDLGPRGSTTAWFPLSDSWRKPQCRRHDWTARVLSLLSG